MARLTFMLDFGAHLQLAAAACFASVVTYCSGSLLVLAV